MAKQEKFSCPNCGMRYNARPDWAGQRAKCKGCKNTFLVPGTPSSNSAAPNSNSAAPPTDGIDSLPEAKIVTNTPSPPKAQVIMDAEPVPFLEPLNAEPLDAEPVASQPEIYGFTTAPPTNASPVPSSEANPFGADPFADPAVFGPEAGGTMLKPVQYQRQASVGPKPPRKDLLPYLLSRPLACILFISTLLVLIIFNIINNSSEVDIPFYIQFVFMIPNFLLVALGMRHDRGDAWNHALIRIFMVIGITFLSLAAIGIIIITAILISQSRWGELPSFLGQCIISFTVNIIAWAIYYALMKAFGFFRTNAVLALLPCLAFILATIILGLSDRTDEPTAREDSPSEYSQKIRKLPDTHAFDRDAIQEKARKTIEQTRQKLKDGSLRSKNSPQQTENRWQDKPSTESAPVEKNPFGTTEPAPRRKKPVRNPQKNDVRRTIQTTNPNDDVYLFAVRRIQTDRKTKTSGRAKDQATRQKFQNGPRRSASENLPRFHFFSVGPSSKFPASERKTLWGVKPYTTGRKPIWNLDKT